MAKEPRFIPPYESYGKALDALVEVNRKLDTVDCWENAASGDGVSTAGKLIESIGTSLEVLKAMLERDNIATQKSGTCYNLVALSKDK